MAASIVAKNALWLGGFSALGEPPHWLAVACKILYPDKVSEDIRAQTREFYAMFYHRTPSDAQIDNVLAGRD